MPDPPPTEVLSLLQRMAIAEANAREGLEQARVCKQTAADAVTRADTAETRADEAALAAAAADRRHRRLAALMICLALAVLAGGIVLFTQVIYREARIPYVDHRFEQIHKELTDLACALPPDKPLLIRLRKIAHCGRYHAPSRAHPETSHSAAAAILPAASTLARRADPDRTPAPAPGPARTPGRPVPSSGTPTPHPTPRPTVTHTSTVTATPSSSCLLSAAGICLG